MISNRLKELGLSIPPLTPPLASYVPARRAGELVYVSGQLPMKEGAPVMTGPMTPARSLDEAVAAMEISFLNALAAAATVVDPDRITEVIRLGAYVASESSFTEQHRVANGASDLAAKIFGEPGRHARFAVGVPSLPLNATVELEVIFRTDGES